MAILRVETPTNSYPIYIEPDILTTLAQHRESLDMAGRTCIVTNPTLYRIYGERLAHALPNATASLMLDGERYKTLNTVEMLYGEFISAGLDRKSTVIAFGGGVIGDTAGFTAATYMRGIRFIQIPTTLLSMVDSSVGGKVGVDLPQGKNLVGAFKQPDLVIVDPKVLETLPAREWRCGMAELIKHGLLADSQLLDPQFHHPNNATDLITRAVQVKIDIVQRDPYEQGERAFLNLGHTFGHAIEQVTHYNWLHGEAVAVGLVAAARLSCHLGLCDSALVEQIEMILTETGLPTSTAGLDPHALLNAMRTDKKRIGNKLRFILLQGVCQPVIVDDVPETDVLQILEDIR